MLLKTVLEGLGTEFLLYFGLELRVEFESVVQEVGLADEFQFVLLTPKYLLLSTLLKLTVFSLCVACGCTPEQSLTPSFSCGPALAVEILSFYNNLVSFRVS